MDEEDLSLEVKIPDDDGVLEAVLLNQFATNPDFIARFSGALDHNVFTSSTAKKIYRLVHKFQTKYPGNVLSMPMLKKIAHNHTEIQEMVEMIVDTPEFPQEMIFDEAVSFIKRKKLEMAFLESWDDIKNPDSYAAIESRVKAAITSVATEDLGTNYFDDASIRNRYARKREVTVGCVKSLYPAVDELLLETNKSFARGTLNVISGQSNIGKSIWLGQIALNASRQKKTVGVVTLEMGEDSYASRFDCNITKIPTEDLHDEDKVVETLMAYKSENECDLFIKQLPTGGASPLDILNYVNSLKMRDIDVDVLVIDYINLMRPNQKLSTSANSYERIKVIAEELRAVAIELDIPVWTATQLNRAGYDTVPTNANTSESMGLVHTADFIMGVYQEEGDKLAGVMRGVIMKNRYGPVDIYIRFGIHYPTLTITSDGDNFEPTADDKKITQDMKDEMSGEVSIIDKEGNEISIKQNLDDLL